MRKPILRDPNGKAIGHGSFWHRKPFDYSAYERDLPQTNYDRICTQDLTFANRQRRVAADDVSVHSTKPNHEKDLDWQIRTGVKMSNKDFTYFELKEAKKLDLFNQEQVWEHFAPWQRHDMKMQLKH